MIPLGVLGASRHVAAGGGWTPADLPGLLAWFDAADAATITQSGGAVSQWADKSGNARHFTQSAPASQPSIGAASIGGVNALGFSGDDWLSGSVPFGTEVCTVAMVASYSAGDRSGFYGGADTSTPGVYQKFTGSNTFAIEPQTEFTFTTEGSAAGTVLVIQHGSSAGAARINGSSIPLIGGPSSSVNGKSITGLGRLARTGIYLTGGIGEVVIASGAITGPDLSSLESHLMTKWGIA